MKFFVLVFHLVSTFFLVKVPRQKTVVSNQQRIINFNPVLFSSFSLGYKRMFSSFHWIMAMIQSDIDRPQKEGEHSWMYYRFLLISYLDIYFYHNYSDGSLYLSVVKNDVTGAKDILERGIKIYKRDLWLNYFGAFNDFFELNDPQSALEKYQRIAHDPKAKGFPFLGAMVKKIESGSLGLKEKEHILKSLLVDIQNKKVKEKIQQSLQDIRAKRELACGNMEGKNSCFQNKN